MKKFFTKLYWFFLLTIIIAGFTAVWIISTQTGSRWLLTQLLDHGPQTLEINSIEGTILDGLSANTVEYENKKVHITATNFHANYSISSLVSKHVRIKSLTADQLKIRIKKNEHKSSKPPSLPEFSIANPVSIDSLNIQQLDLNINDKNYLFENIKSAAKINNSELELKKLSTTYNQIDFITDANLTFSAPFPISAKGTIKYTDVFSASSVHLNGELNNYTLQMTADSHFKNAPEISGKITANGNFYGLQTTNLDLETLDGTLSGDGEISWTDGFKASIDFKGKDLKVEKYNKNFPGTISTNGQYAYENKKTSIHANSNGTLRGYPLRTELNIDIQEKILTLNTAKANIGSNQITFSGNIYPEAIGVLDFTAHATDLKALHSEISGQTKIKGKMNGYLLQPVFDIKLSGSEIKYLDHRIKSYNATISPGVFRDHYYITAQGNGVSTGAAKFNSVYIDGTFSEGAQNAFVELKGDQYFNNLKTGIRGTYDKSKSTWTGRINSFEITEKHLKTYRLANPAELTASKSRQSLSDFCIQQNLENFCINGDLQTQGESRIEIKLSEFPLNKLEHWVPDTKPLKETINGHSILVRKKGLWTAKTIAGFSLTNQLDSTLNFNPTNHDLHGNTNIKFSRLEWINLFTDDIVSPKGHLSAKLAISGSTIDPKISGAILLNDGFARAPELGTEFSDISARINFTADQQADIITSLKSGNGTMHIKGKLDLQKLPRWSVRLDTSGTDFEAINTPVVKMITAPELDINANNDGLSVVGTLGISDTNISLGDLAATAVYPSTDERIIGLKTEVSESKYPYDVNILVKLGENVHISGFGLDSHLSGQIHLTQKSGKPAEGDGSIQLEQGQYKAYGQKLDIEKGDIYFNGPLKTPGLNMRATRKIEADNVTAGLKVSGTLSQPESEVFSDPPLPETDALAYLLTGKPLSGLGERD